VWGLTTLVATFTDAYWEAVELLSPLAVLTVGTGLVFFGGTAALTLVERVGV